MLEKIVREAEITKDDIVIEVGPGIGTLTSYIAKYAKKVITVEIDRTLIPILESTLSEYDNIEIINQDILKVDIRKIVEENGGKHIKIVANLPYYITTPIIMNILQDRLPIESITVMIQKEVAHRMSATPGSKEYGSLSVITNYFSTPYLVANVPRNCFMPRPNVDSAVIKLNILKENPVDVPDISLFFLIIKTAFSQRRKTFLNCMFNSTSFNFDKEMITKIIEESGFSANIRGERFSIEDFANITKTVYKYLKN